jgi:hypothetical protein
MRTPLQQGEWAVRRRWSGTYAQTELNRGRGGRHPQRCRAMSLAPRHLRATGRPRHRTRAAVGQRRAPAAPPGKKDTGRAAISQCGMRHGGMSHALICRLSARSCKRCVSRRPVCVRSTSGPIGGSGHAPKTCLLTMLSATSDARCHTCLSARRVGAELPGSVGKRNSVHHSSPPS